MVLYKYAGGAGIKILEGLRLKITPPNEFNDPFELTPRSKFTWTRERMVDEVKKNPEHFHQALGTGGFSTLDEFMEHILHLNPHQFKEFAKLHRKRLEKSDMDALNEASAKLGILCFSELPASIPMWSHYANNHRGIAIGFDISPTATLPGLARFGKVRYREYRRAVDLLLDRKSPEWFKQITDTIFTKSKLDWAYEQEYRLVFRLKDLISPRDEKGKFFADISGCGVREIIFGCLISDRDEERIRKQLKRHPEKLGHVRLFRCKKNRSKFQLDIVPAD